jgi:predicted TIM-barrel fold metal-dependent hydrolase
LLTEGHLDWLWSEAEKYGVPMMVLVPPRLLPAIQKVAEQHPGINFTLDHMSVPKGRKDSEAFVHMDELVKLAKTPNIAVKATSLSHYTTDAYPHQAAHEPLKKVVDAFGPKRVFWGTDLTKLRPGSYREAVTMFTEEMPWLSGEDKTSIMGRGLCAWLGWRHPRA